MKLVIHNFGKVNEADVDLNGITVIAGPNGSGKSTIGRVFFTWHTYLRQLDAEVVTELASSVIDDVNSILSDNELPNIYTNFDRIRVAERIVKREFWQDPESSIKWIAENMVRRLVDRYDNPEYIFDKLRGLFSGIRQTALSRIAQKHERLDEFLLERHFSRAFDRQVGTLYDSSARSSVELFSDTGRLFGCVFAEGRAELLADVHAEIKTHMFYLEPRHLIDEMSRAPVYGRFVRFAVDRYSVDTANRWERILNTEPNLTDMTFAQSEIQAEINKELDQIVETIHGEIGREDRSLVFHDNDIPDANAVSLKNVASGVKTMVAIVRGMRNATIKPGDLLIIDEPETNLHPEWQVAFAHFLVRINAKFGIRMLLNTHSPYFLKAISVYSDLLERNDGFCSYYNMVPAPDGVRYDTKVVDGQIEEVFKAMSTPFAKLTYGDHYERHISS